MRTKKILAVVLALFMVFSFFGGLAAPETVQAASKIKLSSTKKTLEVGKSFTLKVTGTKEKITWKSSDKSVATVTSKGKVTAKKAGKATITAKVGKKKLTCKVTVKASTQTTGEEVSATLTNAKAGDTVKFGKYEQDNNSGNGKEDIIWYVLDKQDGKLLLMSKYALDGKAYNDKQKDVTWETCSLRKWLNSDFYDMAFSSKEKNIICETEVVNDGNSRHSPGFDIDIDGGNDTKDFVYLLSLSELVKYFNYTDNSSDTWDYSGDKRTPAKVTAYAKQNGAYAVENDNAALWWLRTPGCYNNSSASGVNFDGSVGLYGSMVDNTQGSVRPIVWVRCQ